MNEKKKIKLFTDLDTWQEGHKLVLMTYKITKDFPKEETYCLITQLRRASISITSNIAEGFSRKSYQDKIRFYCMSLGSTTEIQNQLIVSRDLKYITSKIYNTIYQQSIKVHKLLNGLIKKSNYIHNS